MKSVSNLKYKQVIIYYACFKNLFFISSRKVRFMLEHFTCMLGLKKEKYEVDIAHLYSAVRDLLDI